MAWFSTGGLAAEPSVIAEWDFNDATSFSASRGEGLVRLLGGVVGTNFLGTATDPGKPNGALSLRSFPAQGQRTGSAGLEFATSSAGWQSLAWRFELRASGTASRRLQILVAADEEEFLEAGRFEIPQDGVFVSANFEFSAFSNLNEADVVRIRMVSEFDESGQYSGVKVKSDGANSYSAAGTWRFDRVVLTGEPVRLVPHPIEVQVARDRERIELVWPDQLGSSCTVWWAPSPEGPWESAAAGLFEPSYSEATGVEPRFFRVTSP